MNPDIGYWRLVIHLRDTSVYGRLELPEEL